jgi:hypothetical protein
MVIRSTTILSMVRQLRRRDGKQKSSKQARAAPPAVYQRPLWRMGYARALLVAAAVKTVRVAVCEVVPLSVTEAGVRLHPAGSLAAMGVMAQLRLTTPVYPAVPGVTVIVEVFPVVAPGATETAGPVMVKGASAGVVTVTEVVFEALV